MERLPLKLVKLKTRDELLRTAPELGRLLTAGDAEGTAAAPGRAPSPLKSRGSPTSKRTASPGRLMRKYTDDELTDEERVRAELEKVKAERAALLTSLARLRADSGKSGGELQQEDIQLLRRELQAKVHKLNELRRATRDLTDTLEQLETTSRDCQQLMPQAMADLVGRVEALQTDLAAVEQDIVEAEAKHELYKLLEIRTRRDHSSAQKRMREARALKEGAADDYTALTKQLHEMRASKEDAERDLGAVVMMFDQVRSDWSKKLKDRRKEVRELERRRADDDKRKSALTALAAEKARLEQEKVEKSRNDREAATRRLSAVVPELETLEATWARLHGVCGASSAEDLIAYWQELKTKEAGMRELVRLAEVREARAKQEMAELLAEKAEVFDTETARNERRQRSEAEAATEAGPIPVPEQALPSQQQQQQQVQEEQREQQAVAELAPSMAEEEALSAAAGGADVAEVAMTAEQVENIGHPGAEGAAPNEALPETDARKPNEVPAESAAATEEGAEEFSPTSDAPGSQEQGTKTAAPAETAASAAQPELQPGINAEPAPELEPEGDGQAVAANEAAQPAAEATPATAEIATPATPPAEAGTAVAGPSAAAVPDIEHLLRQKQAQIAEARRRKKAAKETFSKLSQVCVAADQGLQLLVHRLKGALDSGNSNIRRLSALQGNRRLTSAADSRRSSVGGRLLTMNRRTTAQQAMRISAAGLIERRASIQLLPAPMGADGITPRAPQGSSIHDKEFFPELPSVLADVGGQLDRLMQMVADMELAAAAAEEAPAAAITAEQAEVLSGHSQDSDFSIPAQETALEASPPKPATAEAAAPAPLGSRVGSKRLQWADGQPTPRMGDAGQEGGEGGADEEGPEDELDPEEAAAAAAQGEKRLRKGFKRRTWAGPAWLNTVSSSEPLTVTLRKVTATRGSKPAVTPGAGGARALGRIAAAQALRRVVGYVEEPGSGDECGNPFVLSSSEEEAEEDCVVDRQYLKHRARKLTNPKVRGNGGVGPSGPGAQLVAR